MSRCDRCGRFAAQLSDWWPTTEFAKMSGPLGSICEECESSDRV